MYFRLIITLLLTIFLEHSSFSAPTMPLKEQSLKEFAEAFKVKNYIVARDNALKSPDSPTRNFMLGVASYRLENWEDTVKYLAKSVDDFELLADYTLYYRADALSRLSRYEESLALLDKLKRNYPASRFLRGANSLYADNLFNKKEYQRALDASQSFIETYPSGADALRASLQATLSREALGNKQRAVSELRNIWLNHPGSPVAAAAEANLQRLKAEQITVPPYTAEELLKRGNILYSLGKYSQAMETLNAVSRQTMTGKMKTRLDFKSAQALFKSREYRKAEHLFTELAEGADREISTEATYWLARTQEKRGLEDRAVATYLKLAEGFPGSELADDALLQAALSRRGHGDKSAAVSLLDRLLDRYPSSTLKPRALWEKSWARYLSRDFRGASESLKRLLDNASYREKALYWLGKSEEASGERERSNAAFKLLREEYPFGFYSLHFRKEAGLRIGLLPALDSASVSSIPLPSGYKRVKALISFGMFNEARMELAAVRIKGASSSRFLDLARLYWEISDYRSALISVQKAGPNTLSTWGYSYPIPYRDAIVSHTAKHEIPESLAYSIIRAESSFSPTVLSPVGAVGLMQLMPATARSLAKVKSEGADTPQLTSPELNIGLGVRHLKNLLVRFNGNLIQAVAAYNSGATPVERWLKISDASRPDEFIENIPYPETREYVKKVLTNLEIYNALYNGVKPVAAIVPKEADPPSVNRSEAVESSH